MSSRSFRSSLASGIVPGFVGVLLAMPASVYGQSPTPLPTSSLPPVEVNGALRVGKVCAPGDPPLRAIVTHAVVGASSTNVPGQTLHGNATVTRDETATAEVNDGSYRMVLTREISGQPVDYLLNWQVYVDGNVRVLDQDTSATMPLAGDLQLDLGWENAVSILVTVATTGADITQLRGIVTAPGIDSAFTSSTELAPPADPIGSPGYVSVTDGGGTERATFELLVPPGHDYDVQVEVGFDGGAAQLVETFHVAAADLQPCGTFVAPEIVAAPEPTGMLLFDLFFEPDPADILANVGPRATFYNMAFFGSKLNGDPVVINSNGYLEGGNSVSNGLGPVLLSSVPVPFGIYYMTIFPEHPKISLTWPDRTAPSDFPSFFNFPAPGTPPLWSPVHYGSSPGHGIDEDGGIVLDTFDAQPDGSVVERLTFRVPMAYVRGQLGLAGCVETRNIDAGRADVFEEYGPGAGTPYVNELGQNRTRGNPYQGNGHGLFENGGTGVFEIPLSAGTWSEYAYRLHLSDGNGLDDYLAILPDTSRRWIHTLQPGRANQLDLPNTPVYPTGSVVVRVTVQNTPEQIAAGAPVLRPFRKPRLAAVCCAGPAGADYAVNAFSGLNGDTGKFWSYSNGEDVLRNEHFVRIIGVADSVADIAVTAQVPVNPDGSGAAPSTSFPNVAQIPFTFSAGGCNQTCVDVVTKLSYPDDGAGPAIDHDPLPPVTAAASIVVAGTAVDATLVTTVTVNGQPVATGPQPTLPYQLPVSLAFGLNTITIRATDVCGHVTESELQITRALVTCGDAVVDSGETCDPPGSPVGVNGNPCRADCTACGDGVVQGADGEQCDDNNDAECDPARPQRPLNGDGCNDMCLGLICNDPARIKLTDQLDVFKLHGVLVPIAGDPIDFSDGAIGVRLVAGHEIVFATSLESGEVAIRKRGTATYKNAAAKHAGGFYRFQAIRTPDGRFKVSGIFYGDLEKATQDMVTYVTVGAREWSLHGTWRRRPSGWLLQHPLR